MASVPTRAGAQLVVGRFQPLHHGHLAVLDAASAAGRVTVILGSANAPPSLRNPFTVAQRTAMLQAVRPGLRIVPVPDYGDGAKWASHVLREVPDATAVWGNDDATLQCFAGRANAAGRPIEVHRIGLRERGAWQAATIRAQLVAGDKAWRKAVPKEVAVLLEAWDAGLRLRALGNQPA